jgi:hypothetical protein
LQRETKVTTATRITTTKEDEVMAETSLPDSCEHSVLQMLQQGTRMG